MTSPSADRALPSARAWLAAFAAALDVDAPDDETMEALLALAGTAAHSSERIAAPIACFLAAKAGVGLERAQAIASSLQLQAGTG
jgi:hypothetical protein